MRREAGGVRRAQDDLPAAHPLAHVVIRLAFQHEADAGRQEHPEALPRSRQISFKGSDQSEEAAQQPDISRRPAARR